MAQEEFGAKPDQPAPLAQKITGSQQPLQRPPGVNVPLRPPLKVVEPPAAAEAPAANAPIPIRTLPQTEAAMVQKGAPPTEAPQSQFTATGERKSPELRAIEITNANRTAKAQRFAQALHESGITSSDAAKIEAGTLGNEQIKGGMTPRWGNIATSLGEKNPSDLSVPQIIGELRKLEKGNSGAIAQKLKAAMEESGTITAGK